VDAVRAADAFKFSDVEGEVLVTEASTSVVDVGEACGGGEWVVAGGGARGEGKVEFSEDLIEDEAGKEGTEGAALGEAFLLEKGGPGGGFGTEPAGVGGVIEHVEEGGEAAECGVAAKDGAAGFTGDGVEHVDDVKEEEGMGRGLTSSL
jgi:hypothetical protein